jgi:predicted dehydrogenase
MNIAIIGCGVIGAKRAKALGKHKLIIAADKKIELAENIANGYSALATNQWKEAAAHPDVEVVIVSTTNDCLVPVSGFALDHGKHVLVEKPAARNLKELDALIKKASSSDKKIKVGFNLRFHPALIKAKEIIDSGNMGELMFIRARYGHGGRKGYDREWRADPAIAGGGELLDQGVHLIDLSRWFLGDFTSVEGFVKTYYWDMPVEDNGFLALRTKSGQAAWLQVSCTEWKNMFCLEIYGRSGKLQIDGLGGSYGTERLSYYKMSPEMGPPETVIWEYHMADTSWKDEFDYFIRSIVKNTEPQGNLKDAQAALSVVQKIYGGEQ